MGFKSDFGSGERFLTNFGLKSKFQPNIGLFRPNLHPYFGHFGGQKNRFFDFFKHGLELFRSCLGIIFGLKRLTFSCIIRSKGWYMTSKTEILGQILPSERVILTIFRV